MSVGSASRMTPTVRLRTARAELARRIEHWFELPMALLGVVWLLLLVFELLRGATRWSDLLTNAIWAVFIIEFSARLVLAPRKGAFLRRHWLTALSLALPALRVLRFARLVRLLRAGRTLRAVRLARLLTSFSRGMRALGATMQTRGVPYVFALTFVVLLLGAAGMHAFERDHGSPGFTTFPAALWWTAMIITTMGSEFWPRSPEGRLICLLLSVYAFAVFGYLTATLASYFIGSDAASDGARLRRVEAELVAIRAALEQPATPDPPRHSS